MSKCACLVSLSVTIFPGQHSVGDGVSLPALLVVCPRARQDREADHGVGTLEALHYDFGTARNVKLV